MEQFQKMIRELLDSGLSQKALGDELGKSQAWIGAVLAGEFQDLKYSDGQALIKLHADRAPKKRQKAAA